MRKTINFILAFAGMFTKTYLLLIIYNLFIVTNFNLPSLTYWSVFFITGFIGIVLERNAVGKVVKLTRLEKHPDYVEEKTAALVSQLIVFWITIGILLMWFSK